MRTNEMVITIIGESYVLLKIETIIFDIHFYHSDHFDVCIIYFSISASIYCHYLIAREQIFPNRSCPTPR